MKIFNKFKHTSTKDKENKGIKKENNLKKRILITLLMIIPFISIILIISLRHVVTPTNEDILSSIKNMNDYGAIVEYTITNNIGSYSEKAELTYCDKYGIRLDFGEDLTKIYKDDSITMLYNKKGEKYEVDRELDKVYDLAAMSELFKNPIVEFKEGKEEWGELEYLKVDFDIVTENLHIDKATLYVDKKKKEPMVIKVFDNKDQERIKIEYREFLKEKKEKCDKEKFEDVKS